MAIEWITVMGLFRWLGPLVVPFGIFTAWQTHAHLNHRLPAGSGGSAPDDVSRKD